MTALDDPDFLVGTCFPTREQIDGSAEDSDETDLLDPLGG